MKKLSLIILALIMIGIKPTLKADEGMWLPLLIERLNYTDMQKMGLQLTAEEIYSVNNSSLKDAIIIFGRGCTGEVVSAEGLILTNHHCGYGRIQAHSTIEHDYLTDGFWAKNKEEELSNPGLTAKFLIRIEDVTNKIISQLNDEMTEEERTKKIREISKEIQQEATSDSHYDASVKSFYFGNEFYLFVYETFKDVRLVGAPPSSIGKFGADTDNWMWPRHTGDFSMFRVYTAPDRTPAEYSDDNIPFQPKHFLPISIAGFHKGDFAMILGYPGGTDRYMTSYGVDLAIEQSNMTVVKIRQEKLDIMRADMDASNEVRIKYASKYARTSNYWKYFIGQTKGLKRLNVAGQKRELEETFQGWADANALTKEKYGNVLSNLEKAYENYKEYDLLRIYFSECIARGSEAIGFAGNFSTLKKELMEKKANQEKIDQMITGLEKKSAAYFKNYNQPTDKKLMAAMLEMYYNNIPAKFYPEQLTGIAKKYKGDFQQYADMAFSKSIFVDENKMNAFLNDPKLKTIEKDPIYDLMKSFYNFYNGKRNEATKINAVMSKEKRFYMAGLREMEKDKIFYPDANFTMRLTYGTVQDYFPADAIHFDYRTTLSGIMEKEDPSNWEFVVPEKLKELFNTKDFGRYGEEGKMYVGFLTNHDITGGNSGSPVINGKGELIGLAFDGNWEAMSGDIAFEPGLQRTINVDIRYVLFIIDKYAGAQNIIDELTIVSE